MQENNALIIFIKNAVQGKVKTRLAKSIGEEEALLVYKELLELTRALVSTINIDKYLFYSDFIDLNDSWDNQLFKKELQTGKHLGERMQNAFELVLAQATRAVIIGSDCPDLSSDIIQKAFEELDTKEVVIGPSLDGGYYLLGMKVLHRELFSEISWSTSEVLSSSIAKLEMAGLSYGLLEVLDDIDEVKDLVKWRKGL